MFEFLRLEECIMLKKSLPPFENKPIIVSKDIDINDLFNKKEKNNENQK